MLNRKFQEQEQRRQDKKAQFLNFVQSQNKTDADYINFVTSNAAMEQDSDVTRLEAMVRTQLKREFPGVERMTSYELLVDAVMHNYMKKQLQATEGEIA